MCLEVTNVDQVACILQAGTTKNKNSTITSDDVSKQAQSFFSSYVQIKRDNLSTKKKEGAVDELIFLVGRSF